MSAHKRKLDLFFVLFVAYKSIYSQSPCIGGALGVRFFLK